jgi:hypothetical protein
MVGLKNAKLIGEKRELHKKELYALHVSPNIIRVKKNQRIRWVEHVACMGERRLAYRVVVRRPERKRPLGRPRLDIGGKEWIFKQWNGEVWSGLIWFGIETGVGIL